MKIRQLGMAIVGTSLAAGLTGVFKCQSNTLNKNLSQRLQHMEYVKQNNINKYIESLEIINKTNSPRISPEYINNLWAVKAREVRDSINIAAKNNK